VSHLEKWVPHDDSGIWIRALIWCDRLFPPRVKSGTDPSSANQLVLSSKVKWTELLRWDQGNNSRLCWCPVVQMRIKREPDSFVLTARLPTKSFSHLFPLLTLPQMGSMFQLIQCFTQNF
jgi:hypothetical protein